MKFTCERCGKKYATAEDPAPGRVYKLKCKACGHLIVVKASALSGSVPDTGPVTGGTPPAISLEVGTPERALGHEAASRPNALDSTTEVSTAAMRGMHALETTPHTGEPGYVDLFSDLASPEPPQKPADDPFMAAARASLPDGYGSGSSQVPDPFAGLREDISASSVHEPPPKPAPAVPKVPVIPKPRQEKSAMPLVLIGAGVAVMVGILAFVMLSSGKKGPAPALAPAPLAQTAPPIAAPAPTPPAPAPEAVQPAPPTPPPAQAAPPKADDAEKRARAEQKKRDREEAAARERDAREAKNRERAERDAREREARAERDREKADREARARAEREAKAEREREAKAAREAQARADREARDRAAAEARERERQARQAAAADAAADEPDGGLTQSQIEGVLRSTKPSFDSCIQSARGTDVKLDGRRVMLRLNIQTTGAVTYPTLDDVTLNGTELGSCLKSAARLMVFPKFKGDTMHVEVPLVMR